MKSAAYYQGQLDAEIRLDAKRRCGPGTKPCGDGCIPKEYDCHIGVQGIKDDLKRAALNGAFNGAALVGIGSGYLAGQAYGQNRLNKRIKALAEEQGEVETLKKKTLAAYEENRRARRASPALKMRDRIHQVAAGARGVKLEHSVPFHRRRTKRDALETRLDMRCSPGYKLCGKRCIPNHHTCHKNMASSVGTVNSGVATLRPKRIKPHHIAQALAISGVTGLAFGAGDHAMLNKPLRQGLKAAEKLTKTQKANLEKLKKQAEENTAKIKSMDRKVSRNR